MADYTRPDYTPGDPNDMDPGGQSTGTTADLEAARERLRTAYASAREKSTRAIGQAEEYTRKSPLEALGYAAAAGAVLGLLAGVLFGRKH